MAIMPYVHRGPEVTAVRIVLGGTKRLRPTPNGPYIPKLSLKLSNADNTHLMFSKDIVEIFQLKLSELVRAINVECTIKVILTITNHFYRHNHAGFLF
jgi:hypothetical protein